MKMHLIIQKPKKSNRAKINRLAEKPANRFFYTWSLTKTNQKPNGEV